MANPVRATAQGVRARLADLRAWFDNTKLLGRSLSWYLSGWRLGLVFVALAVFFPQITGDQSQILAGAEIGVYVILALGLNIVVGYAGLLDLGYVAFYAIGAYIFASLSSGTLYGADKSLHIITPVSFVVLLPLGALIAGTMGVLLGAPTLRLRGDYLAIVTLGFGEIVRIFFQNVPFFGGVNGITASPIPPVITPFGTFDFGSYSLDHTPLYYLVLFIALVVVVVVTALRESSLGRAFVAIREDETAAAASGVNLVRTKLLAFGTGAAIGGIGGVLQAVAFPSTDSAQYVFLVSITVVVMVVLGGIGSVPGVILGAIILKYFDLKVLDGVNTSIHTSSLVVGANAPLHFLANLPIGQSKYLMYGIVLLAFVLLRPQGIIPNNRRQRELRQAASAEEASSVGALAIEQAGGSLPGAGEEDRTQYAGPGSDAQGREE
jgi:branched-chain amino acid transport system permease protein